MLEAITFKNGKLQILDQLQLPSKAFYQDIASVDDGYEAIKSMKVRGAPAISLVAALSLAVELENKSFIEKRTLNDYIKQKLQLLVTSRPTAVNLAIIAQQISSFSEEVLQIETITVDAMKEKLLEKIESFLATDININKSIGQHGGEHIIKNCKNKPVSILTHCNTGSLATAGYGTALGIIRWLHDSGNLQHTFCTETRPYNQGARLTAYELVHDKIPATLICDSMVAALMKPGKVSAVVVGADRVVANGDTANKIGTYQIAVCAKYHNIPFYVACPKNTFDFALSSGDLIPIEERPHCEMTSINSIPIAAEGINCWNPAFDITPGDLITGGIVTEVGVFSPSDLRKNRHLLSS